LTLFDQTLGFDDLAAFELAVFISLLQQIAQVGSACVVGGAAKTGLVRLVLLQTYSGGDWRHKHEQSFKFATSLTAPRQDQSLNCAGRNSASGWWQSFDLVTRMTSINAH
jgi:hypothetical protein